MRIKYLIPFIGILLVSIMLTGCVQEVAVEEGPTAGFEAIEPPEVEQVTKDVTPTEAYSIIEDNKDNENFIILDVRTAEEFSEGYIEGATNLDFYAEGFRDQLSLYDRDNTYVIYCGSGKRGGMALEMMTELGFKEVYHIEGGLGKVKEEGLAVVTP